MAGGLNTTFYECKYCESFQIAYDAKKILKKLSTIINYKPNPK